MKKSDIKIGTRLKYLFREGADSCGSVVDIVLWEGEPRYVIKYDGYGEAFRSYKSLKANYHIL